MIKKHYRLFWLCFLMTVVIAGCDSTKNNNDANNYQLTIAAAPTNVLTGEFSTITATLNNVDTSVATGTSTTTTTPVVGYPVTFTIAKNTSKCSLTVANNLTDTTGKALAIYRSGAGAGVDVIQVSIDKGQTASASIIVNLSPTPTPTPTPTP
ncbi:MAG: hypothetical protein V1844_00920 [Pseudomonadota bacterium]